jgi:hypothetical protein
MNNWTRHVALVRVRSNSVIAILWLFPFIVQNWTNTSQPTSQPSEILRICHRGTGKVTTDIKQKQRAVIEFLLLQGCECDEMMLRLQNVCGLDEYCRASVSRWMNEIPRGNEELRYEGRPGRPYRYETKVVLRQSAFEITFLNIALTFW